MTSTHSASGMSGHACMTVSGLDETELIMIDEELDPFLQHALRMH